MSKYPGNRLASYASQALSARIDERAEEFVGWLLELAAMPSVSATGEGILACAEALAERCRSLGIETELLETGGAPMVRGSVGSGGPRIVVYGHYDVQPAGNLEEWTTPPFTPTIRDGAVWGRGVGDNKGQLLAHLCALAAWKDVFDAPPPFELVFAFDGEEEIGSPHAGPFVASHPEYFAGDFYYAADASTLGIWNPAIFLNLHGLLYLELEARGSSTEWHSGSFGGVLPNPVERLASALATLTDGKGEVLVAGFGDDVLASTAVQRDLVAALPDGYLDDPAEYGVTSFVTDNPREAMFLRPKLTICGFRGGYTGEGVMTSVPTEAVAKIDITLVPRQDPERIAQAIRDHLKANGFDDIEVRVLASCPPVETPYDDPFVQTAIRAMTNVWGKAPTIFPSIGGGGPPAAFAKHGMTCLCVPYAQADLHEHSTIEHLSLEWFVNGIKTSAELFRLLAEEQPDGE